VLLHQRTGSLNEATSAIRKALRYGVRDSRILREVAVMCDSYGGSLAVEAEDIRARATLLEAYLI
jgi:hypothetical protein